MHASLHVQVGVSIMIVLPDPPSFATLDPMTYGAEENRPLYQQVVDDIQDQIASA